MAFDFRIYFSGLCVLVPDKLEAPESCDVLLVNLLLPRLLQRKQDPADPSSPHEILDPHFPLLIFDDPGPQGRTADFKPRLEIGDHGGRNVCLLLHDQLEILPDGNPVNAPIDVSSTGDRALEKIAKVKDVFPGRGEIDKNLLTVELKPEERRVVSRIRGLSGGKLWTEDLSKTEVEIQGAGASSTTFPNRRIAVRLGWQIRCQSHMTLRWSRYNIASGKTVEAGNLRWDPKPDNSRIEIWIENREIDAFIGVPLSYPVARALADFEVYFSLEPKPAASINAALPAPIPIPLTGVLGGPGVGSLHGGMCPPTLMLRPGGP